VIQEETEKNSRKNAKVKTEEGIAAKRHKKTNRRWTQIYADGVIRGGLLLMN
jgi:hypothetical protein